MKSIYSLPIIISLLFSLQINNFAQSDTLKLEYGILIGTFSLVDPPNTVDGWGSSDNGDSGDSLVYIMAEMADSYNGTLSGSSWESYGYMASKKQIPSVEVGLGFYPDTVRYLFLDNENVEVQFSDAEGNYDATTGQYFLFPGTGSYGIDSLLINNPSSVLISHNIQLNNSSLYTGINKVDLSHFEAKVYPNPSNGIFTVKTSVLGEYVISVVNTIGSVVYEQTFESNFIQIDLDNLIQGIYFLRIENTEQRLIKKITIR